MMSNASDKQTKGRTNHEKKNSHFASNDVFSLTVNSSVTQWFCLFVQIKPGFRFAR